ncbi:slit homolog 3 protein-like [Tetranychus urticae]|uniref:LRRNT domain-containing protein n=1 Tax=Tetranychus urticae TaxID=32264 RepID=T1L5T7_TETUR|nr:slit homolog 3 protein-like [Tetranychus urticae]
MFNNFLLICSLCLVFVSVHCEPDSADCPDPKSIEPCHCDREGISCFNSLDEQKLSQVFKVPNGYNAYRSVWITQNSIYNLTRNIFNGLRIQSFFIEENEIETVEEGAFTDSYEIVKQISLHRNKIKSFPFNELGLMEQLEKLTLSHNKLTTIPANSFSLATKLSAIDLSDNEIETLEPGAFFGMRNLQLILLGNNKLTQLPALSFGSNLLFTVRKISNPF